MQVHGFIPIENYIALRPYVHEQMGNSAPKMNRCEVGVGHPLGDSLLSTLHFFSLIGEIVRAQCHHLCLDLSAIPQFVPKISSSLKPDLSFFSLSLSLKFDGAEKWKKTTMFLCHTSDPASNYAPICVWFEVSAATAWGIFLQDCHFCRLALWWERLDWLGTQARCWLHQSYVLAPWSRKPRFPHLISTKILQPFFPFFWLVLGMFVDVICGRVFWVGFWKKEKKRLGKQGFCELGSN